MELTFSELMTFIIEEMAGDNPLELTDHGNFKVNKLIIRTKLKKAIYKQYEWDITEDTLDKLATFYKWMYNEA